jgi:hypothetical protein
MLGEARGLTLLYFCHYLPVNGFSTGRSGEPLRIGRGRGDFGAALSTLGGKTQVPFWTASYAGKVQAPSATLHPDRPTRALALLVRDWSAPLAGFTICRGVSAPAVYTEVYNEA